MRGRRDGQTVFCARIDECDHTAVLYVCVVTCVLIYELL